MIYRIKNTHSVGAIFDDWKETIIRSCLEGVMGEIYADDTENPRSAMAVLGDFCFFAGKVSEELINYKSPYCNQDFMIMIPQNDEWAEMIERVYKGNARKVERYAIKKEKDIFDIEKLNKIAAAIPVNCTLHLIDKKLYYKCKKKTGQKLWYRSFLHMRSIEREG